MYAISVGAGAVYWWTIPEQRNHLALLRSYVTLEVIKSAVQSRSFVVKLNYSPNASRLQGLLFVSTALTVVFAL
jgi:hypothetical protein